MCRLDPSVCWGCPANVFWCGRGWRSEGGKRSSEGTLTKREEKMRRRRKTKNEKCVDRSRSIIYHKYALTKERTLFFSNTACLEWGRVRMSGERESRDGWGRMDGGVADGGGWREKGRRGRRRWVESEGEERKEELGGRWVERSTRWKVCMGEWR